MTTGADPGPTRLGRYDVLAPIGSGGMAAIYLARISGPAGFEKPVALKVIHAHLAEDQQFIDMFVDEARIAAQIQHPNVVNILELGEADGNYFIAMEYLRGETVGGLIQRVATSGANIDPRLACHVIMEACEGLHYAHEMTDLEGTHLGLVHRDVSPHNLFITYSGSVKLVDFGIARAAGLAHSTRPGSLKGKFSYMSPEQAGGFELDSRSDVFAMGIVLWEMLVGKRLFKGSTDLDSLRRVSEANVPTVSSMRTGISPFLDQVTAKVLARDPSDRHQTALELHEDLSLVLDQLGSPMTTHELGWRMRKWFQQEEQKKKALLTRAMKMAQVTAASLEDTIQVAIEPSPSLGESSGIRVREHDEDFEGEQTTPSVSGVWDSKDNGESSDSGVVDAGMFGPAEQPGQALPSETGLEDQPPTVVPSRTLMAVVAIAGLLALVGFTTGVVWLASWLLGSDEDPAGIAVSDPTESPLGVDLPAGDGPVSLGPNVAQIGAAGGIHDEPPAGRDGATSALPAGADTVTFSLNLRPPHASVLVDGEAHDDPSNIVLARSEEEAVIVVSASGYRERTLRIVPDSDHRQLVVLRRRRGRRPQKVPTKRTDDPDLTSNPYAPQ